MVRVPEAQSDPYLARQNQATYIYSILKPHGQSLRRQVRLLLSEAKPSYIFSFLKPHGQSSRSQVRPLLSEAKPSYIYSILKPHGQSFRNSTEVAPNSITLPLHVVLNWSIHGLALPGSVVVWLGFWNSEHDETWKWDNRRGNHCHKDGKAWILKQLFRW